MKNIITNKYMDVNRVLVFRSLDAKKQNSNNRPGYFTTKFIPEMILDDKYYLALDHISMERSGGKETQDKIIKQ